ncbi:MAG TPA: hypothetical protein VGR31_14830 [Planctomycetota bacterium]|jgi:hypothetical protein|nr:hypothetical protein [Planctomycetota bacterium]
MKLARPNFRPPIRTPLSIRRVVPSLALAAAAFAGPALANEQLVLRSGQIGGAPGAYGQLDDTITCTYVAGCDLPLAPYRFDSTHFAAASAGVHAVICFPLPPWAWPASLPSDPLAQWINWGDTGPHGTTSPGSVLYAMDFQVTTVGATTCSVNLDWAVDDKLGDPLSTDPNPSGAFINGVSLDSGFGNSSSPHAQVGVPVHPGTNTLYLYQRDTGCSDAGLMFSCTITVDAPCENEVHTLRSGQHNGAPGSGGQLDDLIVSTYTPICNTPLSNVPFVASDFAAASSGFTAVICFPLWVWPQSLPNDPDARWINWGDSGPHGTTAPGSALYAVPFVVSSASATTASLELSWMVDDQIGDPVAPNPIGAYMNGVVLDAEYSGGGSQHVQSGIAVHPGLNTLYVYQRDSGCSDAGIMFSATIRIPVPCGSTSYCAGDGSGVACPCGNSGLPGHGCENSSTTGGALLTMTGTPSLGGDTVQFTCAGERPTALSVVLQGTVQISAVNYGDGLRCIAGSIKRLYIKNAVAGTVIAPQGVDPTVSARSAALGNTIPVGSSRFYQVYYRDPIPTFCPNPPGGTFNVSNAIRIDWGF